MRKNYVNMTIGILTSALLFSSVQCYALQPPPMSYPFPMEQYDQNISHWIKPSSVSVSEKPLLNAVVLQAQFKKFKSRFLLPWDDQYISELSQYDIKTDEDNLLKSYSSKMGRISCDLVNVNFNASYPDSWIQNLTIQVNSSQFAGKNSAQGKAITLDNLHVRVLPTDDRYFHDCNLPGEGDSFDYMQMSAVWAGTPVYIIGESADHNWYLIRSPDVRGWVKSAAIKRVSDQFVSIWRKAVNEDNSLVAINSPMNSKQLIIADDATQTRRFTGYIGAIFPLDSSIKSDGNGFHILIPVQESDLPVTAYLSNEDANLIPLASTKDNFDRVINNMIGRSYGWGSLNIESSKDFLNDCSQELKSLFTPFGIWLPRNSGAQVDQTMIVGMVDKTFPTNSDERIAKLVKDAEKHAFMTIVNIGGHIFLYLGSYENAAADVSHAVVPLTYQNMWGLRPIGQDGRYVIGKSVLLPLLSHYPEKYPSGNLELSSPASKAQFIAAYLDELPPASLSVSTQYWSYFGMGAHASKLSSLDEWYSMQPPS